MASLEDTVIVLWERTRRPTPPQVTMSRSTVGRNGMLSVAWKSKVDKTAEPEVWLQWQRADRNEWRALRVGVRGNSAPVSLDCLPSGSVRVRALLHDGFSTASAESRLVKIPARAPQAGIIHPADDTAAPPGSSMLLWGYAAGCDGGESLTWKLNGKVIGTGRTLPIELPAKGTRLRIELEAKDSHGTTLVTRNVSMGAAVMDTQ